MTGITIDNFSLAQIAASGQCFRMNMKEGGCEIIARDKRILASQTGDELTFSCDESEFKSFWYDYFDLSTDYGRIISSIDTEDEYLTSAAAFGSGIRILRQDVWEMIVTFLISQQNNIPRIKRCVENLCSKYGEEKDGFFAFPEPEALAGLDEDALMECNLGYRSKYVVRTARMAAEGVFNPEEYRRLGYQAAKEELLKLYGVGSKVADCVCLFALHTVDAFPIDTHIKQVLARYYPGGFPFERYRGFAGVLQQYMFYYDLNADMSGKN